VPPFVAEPGERPAGSALARHEASSGVDVVTNVFGSRVRLEDPLARALFPLLDGTRDRAALVGELLALMNRAGAFVEHQGRRVTDPQEAETRLRDLLDERLRTLARLALLVA
jgi:hypothetical protein